MKTYQSLETVRRFPQMYLKSAEISGNSLSVRLVDQLLRVGITSVLIYRLDKWWIIASEYDWISHFCRDCSIDYFFKNVSGFPELHVNEVHAEALLTAFSEFIFTVGQDAVTDVIPGSFENAIVEQISGLFPPWRRIIAFKPDTRITNDDQSILARF